MLNKDDFYTLFCSIVFLVSGALLVIMAAFFHDTSTVYAPKHPKQEKVIKLPPKQQMRPPEKLEPPEKTATTQTKEELRERRWDKPAEPEEVVIVFWDGKKPMDAKKLHKAINGTMRVLPHICNTSAMHRLIYETACAETDGGVYPVNCKPSADLGMFQIRLETARDTLKWLKTVHPDAHKTIQALYSRKLGSLQANLERNVSYGAAIAATYYWRRAPDAVIETVADRGKLWKWSYNTRFGRGSARYFEKMARD